MCAQTAPGRKQISQGTQWTVLNRVRTDTVWPKGRGRQEKWYCCSGSWCSGAVLFLRLWAARRFGEAGLTRCPNLMSSRRHCLHRGPALVHLGFWPYAPAARPPGTHCPDFPPIQWPPAATPLALQGPALDSLYPGPGHHAVAWPSQGRERPLRCPVLCNLGCCAGLPHLSFSSCPTAALWSWPPTMLPSFSSPCRHSRAPGSGPTD